MATIGRPYLAVEVVRYSSLIEADEEGTFEELEAHRHDFVYTKIAEYHGRIVRATSDSLLVEFASPTEAVRCAVEVQRSTSDRNIDTAPDQRTAFRIGIHSGEVTANSDDLVGRAVAALPRDTIATLIKSGTDFHSNTGNIAMRVAALSDPGGICISGTVRDAIHDQLLYTFEDIGKQNFDIRAGPVDCYAMRAGSAASRPRIEAQDQGGSTNQGNISTLTGVTSSPTLRATLAKAVFTTAVVVTIAIWIAGDWAFLDSFHHLSSNPVRSVIDKLAVMGKPAEAVWPQLAVSANKTPPATGLEELVDPAAHKLIMQGWALYYLPYTFARWQEARRYFQQALELDPRSSEARIGLASILSAKLADEWSPVLQEDIPRAEQLLLEALDKGDGSHQAVVRFTLGVLRQMQTRLPEAQKEFETAISLDSTNARAYFHLGETLLYLGQPERAIPALEKSIRLDPNTSNVALTYWALGTCQLLLGRVDQAIGLLQTARDAKPQMWVPYFYLAGSYGLQGDLKEARSALAESIRLKPAIKSLARMRVENPWLGNPQYWALQEKTLNVGLRRAGLPD